MDSYLRELGLAGNTITEAGGIAILDGLLSNKVIRKMRLRLNPIGYKYTSEIESLLEANNKAYKKKTTPNLHQKIDELQTFEIRRDSVNDELDRKKNELKEKRKDLDMTLKQVKHEKDVELRLTQAVDDRLEAILEKNRQVEQESHALAKAINE